jgi:hypothetical protein
MGPREFQQGCFRREACVLFAKTNGLDAILFGKAMFPMLFRFSLS